MPDVVGLTVQRRSVRGVETKIRRGGRCSVTRTAEVPLPAGVFDGDRLLDVERFTQSLRDLWDRGGFRTKNVRIVIDGRMAVIRRTELPSLGPEKLRQAAGFDIAELLSFPIDEAVFDVDEIEHFERDGTRWAKALVVAVAESTLLELRQAAADAGLRLTGTDLAAEALVRGVRYPAADEETPDGPSAIIDCEDAATNVVIRDQSGVLFARTLNVGVGETTISVADELESALAQLSGTDEQIDVGSSTGAGVSTVVEGIRRTLSYYGTELDTRPMQRLIVAGARGQAAGLLAALEDTLGLPCEQAQSIAQWPDGHSVHGFETPVGGALGGAPATMRHLVLTSDRERAERRRRRTRAAVAASAVPAIALLALSASSRWADVQAARADTEQAREATNALALRLDELEPTRQLLVAWQGETSSVIAVEQQRIDAEVVIRELAASMPDDTRLLSVRIDRGAPDALPPGYAGAAPVGVISITGVADDLDGVGRWLDSVERSQTIAGLWLEQSNESPIGANGDLQALFSVEGIVTAAALPASSTVNADPYATESLETGQGS